jgi:hypothetical protein
MPPCLFLGLGPSGWGVPDWADRPWVGRGPLSAGLGRRRLTRVGLATCEGLREGVPDWADRPWVGRGPLSAGLG